MSAFINKKLNNISLKLPRSIDSWMYMCECEREKAHLGKSRESSHSYKIFPNPPDSSIKLSKVIEEIQHQTCCHNYWSGNKVRQRHSFCHCKLSNYYVNRNNSQRLHHNYFRFLLFHEVGKQRKISKQPSKHPLHPQHFLENCHFNKKEKFSTQVYKDDSIMGYQPWNSQQGSFISSH